MVDRQKAEQTFINWVMGTVRGSGGFLTPEQVAVSIPAQNFAGSLGLNLSPSARKALVMPSTGRDKISLLESNIGLDRLHRDELEIDVTADNISRCLTSNEFDAIKEARRAMSEARDSMDALARQLEGDEPISENAVLSELAIDEEWLRLANIAMSEIPAGTQTVVGKKANFDIKSRVDGARRKIGSAAKEFESFIQPSQQIASEFRDISKQLTEAIVDYNDMKGTVLFNCLIEES
jgi:hypothetical protein